MAQREQEMFDQAMACFNSRGACTAGSCFASYLQQYPNGRHGAEAQTRAAGARNRCVLPNGVYAATRGYTNPSRPAPDGECRGSDQFDVKIEDGTIEFRTDGNRLFRGRVNQETGLIRIETEDITPATKTPFLISGRYDDAQMQNGFCLEGNFKINK
jgi:hypothetical protein